MMPSWLIPLLVAGRFLTRFPWPDPGPLGPGTAGRALPWYPLVGLLIGALLAGAGGLLGEAPSAVAAALILCLWVWTTGGLHLDGLADSADAWVGGLGSRERTLAIMKDPASGPAGVSALVLVLLAKFACIQSLLAAGHPGLLLWAPLMGRAALPLLFATTPYVRPQGLGAEQARTAQADHCRLASALALGLTALVLGWPGWMLAAAAAVLYALVRRALMARLGGFTGDGAGALVEFQELLALVVLALWFGD